MGFLRMTEDLGQTLIIAEHGVIGNHKRWRRTGVALKFS